MSRTVAALFVETGGAYFGRKALDFATIEFLDRVEKLVALADEEVRRERAAHEATWVRVGKLMIDKGREVDRLLVALDNAADAHALTRARLEAAERVVEDVFGSRGMAETLNDLCTCGGGGAEHPHSCGACRLYRVTRRLLRSALDAIPAAAPARAGDDS